MTPPADGTSTLIRVLEADPDLGQGLDAAQADAASRRAVARVISVPAGPVAADALVERTEGALGLLVLGGLVARTLTIGDRASTELLGAGDLLRPWQDDGDDGILPFAVEWRVLEAVRVAVLDERFAALVAPWPAIVSQLLGRAVLRSRWQAAFATISHLTRVDERLLLAFWHFGARWGRVRPDGIAVRLALTHETIGALIGARRPSVTSALGELADRELLSPLGRGEWLLTPAAREQVGSIATGLGGADRPGMAA